MDSGIAHLPREKPTHLVSVGGSLDRVHPGPKEPPTVAVATRDPLPRQRRSRYASRTLRLGLPWWWAPEGRTWAMRVSENTSLVGNSMNKPPSGLQSPDLLGGGRAAPLAASIIDYALRTCICSSRRS